MEAFLANGCGHIPLHDKAGAVRGFALVDAEDLPDVAQFRWHLQEGYVCRWLGRKGPTRYERLHRRLLGLSVGDGVQADHENRNRLDCRRSNLRVATFAENMQNKASARGAASAYRGVAYCKTTGKWLAQAKGEGIKLYKRCRDELDAARIAEAFRRKHMPFAVPDASLDPLPPCPCKACMAPVD